MAGAPSFPVFRPASVADQAVAALRDAIRCGFWVNFLPGEHELARRFNIGRTSLRAALAQLSREGLVEIAKGRRCLIRSHRRWSSTGKLGRVCVVCPFQREEFGPNDSIRLLQMRAQFVEHGFGWEEVFDARLAGEQVDRLIEELVVSRSRVCWLLLLSSPAIQRWFENSGRQALVLGSCHPGLRLPSVDIDYGTVGRHAAGWLVKNGHRQVAVILPHSPMAGDLACRDGFIDYISRIESQVMITQVSGTRNRTKLLSKLDSLLARHPRPTAILSVVPKDSLTILIHLLQSGLRIPDDISLISCDSDFLLDEALPGLARYRTPSVKLARRVVRIAKSMLAGQIVPPRPNLLIPNLAGAATVGPPPAIASPLSRRIASNRDLLTSNSQRT